MKIHTCLALYKIAYDDLHLMTQELHLNQNLHLNEEYLSALLKFDTLHRTLSQLITGDIHETMARVQNHIKMFKKAEKGIFSVER